jgi:hypothetical protein
VLQKSLALGHISPKEYKERKWWLDNTKIFESNSRYSEEYHILRMRLAYGEIKLNDFIKRREFLYKEEEKEKKEKEKEEKKRAKERKKLNESEGKPKKRLPFWK